jgi:hypothetical protein
MPSGMFSGGPITRRTGIQENGTVHVDTSGVFVFLPPGPSGDGVDSSPEIEIGTM